MRSRWPVALRSVVGALLLLLGCTQQTVQEPSRPRPVSGTLLISGFGADADRYTSANATKHTLRLVPGADYSGMQDNDIRGFPNGRYVHGWNQVGQHHVRLGRLHYTSRFGEREILRVLQRWGDVPLSTDAVVTQVSLEIVVETGLRSPADIMLYEVHRGWNPGSGGVKRDNTSPPAPGEVWWLEAAHGETDWGLPGASFASKDAEIGDVAPLALATARYVPGDSRLEFSSDALTRYVQQRVSLSEPLLFLLKLSDADEDLSGDVISLYSAEEGDSIGTSRRPTLRIDWHAPAELVTWQQDILLENGRPFELPRLAAKGATRWSVSFRPEAGFESPEIEIRGGTSKVTSEWRSMAMPFEAEWDWVQTRLLAARNPVSLGESLESELRDTWVRTAEPEKQIVTWNFVSPLGREIQRVGDYVGDYRWRVTFDPEIPGRWSYRIKHELTWKPYQSEQVFFDVLAKDLTTVLQHLEELSKRIERSNLNTHREKFERFGDEFTRLERAGMQLLNPQTFRSQQGVRLSSRIDEIRKQLGRALPERPTAHQKRF